MKYSLPQEIEVWYIIPAIRKELTKAMLKMGLTQRAIAAKLNLRESAISQYIHSKRAKDIKFDKKTKEKINQSANNLVKNKSCAVKEIQDICKEAKKNKLLCKVHKEHADINSCCNICQND